MILLQLSAAQGPAECCLAVAKALERLLQEARRRQIEVEVIEKEAADRPGAFQSALLSLDGECADALASEWEGTIQWICPSPYRPNHPRKNWFIGVARCEAPSPALANDIRFEACRASGPGGQHVNKTSSAIRATHLATGVSVRVQSERSQHANKRLALLLISHRLAEAAEKADVARRAQRRILHRQVVRGTANRIFKGEKFEPAAEPYSER